MSWWNDFLGTVKFISDPAGSISGWFNSAGGNIATGIETGFLGFVKSIWDVIIGPSEAILGLLIMLVGVYLLITGGRIDPGIVGKGLL